ncbi:galactose-1-phosphate uridylyltransferase [Exophiala spinifera]|uniref:Galactose-1-phosphate uridylyltransferase n=1 Tax=Exophiala spinifera TaxID=91928 RepID=A0A0D1ZP69_9EURO|nr:galactose-1-phosphate uridylyltransferase [Exophiala spinifera]KIW14592.1 galactose-1-phosphate uridylyltransferase [Exophiala spinifera]
MHEKILDDVAHRRYNPLRASWVLVSPHRTKRPWQGQQESPSLLSLESYDSKCYLCPSNTRASGETNPSYNDVFLFVNDYSALNEGQEVNGFEHPLSEKSSAVLLKAEPVSGTCYVLTFNADHSKTLADMSPSEIVPVIKAWTEVYARYIAPQSSLASLAKTVPRSQISSSIRTARIQHRWMQIFENKGAAMGCSNPHPHGQIWTSTTLPEEPAIELEQLKRYFLEHGRNMLTHYAQLEQQQGERIVFQNATFLVICPWWGTWPFETMIVPIRHLRSLLDLKTHEQLDLAEAIAEITRRYDNLFETDFPYSMGVHQAPLDGSDEDIECSSFHIHFYPPLLRSASVRKFLVGYELMAEPQRDITPEQATARLQQCGGKLYRLRMRDKASDLKIQP